MKSSEKELAVNALYRAVQRYVKSNGGTVIVAGGIQMQEWPNDGSLNYTIAVKCFGKKPEFGEAR